jgi:hypothetical protein
MSLEFSRDFQIKLLINMLMDDKFFSVAVGQVKLTDFGLPACRLLLEVARSHYLKFRTLPNFVVLQQEVERALGAPIDIETRLSTPELESLCVILGWISRTRPNELDPKYFHSRLPDYLAYIRLSQLVQDGTNAAAYIDSVAGLQKQLASVSTKEIRFISGTTPIAEGTGSSGERFGTGVGFIDRKISNGLCRKEMGLLMACSGVGKSNTLINMGVNVAWSGRHCLMISLEHTDTIIRERYQMMAAGIKAELFKKSRATWSQIDLDRYNMFCEGRSPYKGTFTIVEHVGATVADIDAIVVQWKEHIEQQGLNPADCLMVEVDWLGLVSPDGIKRLNKGDSDERVYFRVLEAFNEFKKKHNVIWWSAAQAGKTGDGKEVLNMKDLAWGYGQNNLLDLSMAVAPKATDPAKQEDGSSFSIGSSGDEDDAMSQGVEPPCDRELVISFPKVRNGPGTGTHATVYQGNTLRMWNTKSICLTAESFANKGDINGFYTYIDDHATPPYIKQSAPAWR